MILKIDTLLKVIIGRLKIDKKTKKHLIPQIFFFSVLSTFFGRGGNFVGQYISVMLYNEKNITAEKQE